ncbi:MAG: CoA transferase [Chloroflexi bacterium]|nr:CoA transferase [Chloroflexota bacterium]
MTGPLAGIRVLDLARGPAALCARLLGDLGADVIKVEPPEGDEARRWPPFAGDRPHPEGSLVFLCYNSNKRGITLDLAATSGRALLERLAATADVLVESFRPAEGAALGLRYAALQGVSPRLVCCAVTGLGLEGPWAEFQAPELVTFALGGLLYQSGAPTEPPTVAPGHQSWGLAAINAAVAVLAALRARAKTGEGQQAEANAVECMVYEGSSVSRYSQDSHIIGREGSRHGSAAPGDIYPTRDGFVHLYVSPRPGQWPAFRDWIDHPILHDEVWADAIFRRTNIDAIDPIVAEWTAPQEKEGVMAEGQRRHIPVEPVYTPCEFLENDQTRSRGYVVRSDHPHLGPHDCPGAPYWLSATPWALRRPAPRLGEHNAEVYGQELGLSADHLALLRAHGIV